MKVTAPRTNLWLALIWLVLAHPAVAAEPRPLPDHPRLLLNREGIEQLRQKIAQEPWNNVWAAFQAQMDKELKHPIELPPRGGNWSHNYVCPVHGARLKEGRQVGPWQWEHHCPVGPHTLRGNPSRATLDFDGNAIATIHANYSEAVRDLGVAYQVTRDPRYARRAREILLAYAKRYLSYPMHSNKGRAVKHDGGRVASQPLTEARWLVPMAQGADLVWDTLDPSERETLAQKLFRPAIEETILRRSSTPLVHNIQCHRNSAVGLVGLLLDDPRLIENAINGPSGYRANMAQGVQADGVWLEGAWGYHFFTIQGTWPLVEAARNCGIDLYGPELQRLFDAPLRLATPDFRLPAFNDSNGAELGREAELYELGYARYHVPEYTALLAGSSRTNRLALWFGVPLAARAKLPRLGTRHAEASGYAILQQGDGPAATWLCLKYGPHGGGHGHYDKNHFVLYAGGDFVMPDAGTHAYGSPLHGDWDKTSFAHNTLVVDESSQDAATGKCLSFGSSDGAAFAMVDAGPIYRGVRFVRTAVLLQQDLVVFIDHVQADKPRTLDLVCHHYGQWERLPKGNPYTPPSASGYKCLKDGTTRTVAEGFALRVALKEGQSSRILLAGNAPTEAITGTGVGSSTEQRVPLAVFRRVAKETDFIWAVSLTALPPVSLYASTGRDGVATVDVNTPALFWKVTSDPKSGKVTIGKIDRLPQN